MDECKATSTPMHQNEKLRKNDEAEKANKNTTEDWLGV